MQHSIRLLIVTVVAIFVVGVGVKTASSAAIEFAMAMSQDSDGKMSSCVACDADNGQTRCGVDCTTVLVTLLEQSQAIATAVTAQRIATRCDAFVQRGGPPDPYPPKFSILLS